MAGVGCWSVCSGCLFPCKDYLASQVRVRTNYRKCVRRCFAIDGIILCSPSALRCELLTFGIWLACDGMTTKTLQTVLERLDGETARPSNRAVQDERLSRLQSVSCSEDFLDTSTGSTFSWEFCDPGLLLEHMVSVARMSKYHFLMDPDRLLRHQGSCGLALCCSQRDA